MHTSHDGRRIGILDGHVQQITSLAWTMVQEDDHSTQSILATASYDSNVKLWRPRDGTTWHCDQTFSQHTHAVTAVHFQQSFTRSAKNLLVASLDAEGDIRIWCADTLTVKVALSIAGREFTGFTPCPLKFSPIAPYQTVAMAMGTQLVILSLDDSILQHGHASEAVAKRATLPTPHEKSINTLDYSPDGQWLLLASDEKITVWHTVTWQLVYTQTVRMDKISSSTFIGNDTLAWGEYQAMYLLSFQAFVTHAGRVTSHYHHTQERVESPLELSAPTPFENGQKLLTIPLAHPGGSLTGLSWVKPQDDTASSLICSVSTDKYENVRVWKVNPLIASS